MYRLMKSEKSTLGRLASGSMTPYRQIQVGLFPIFRSALAACMIANRKSGNRHYVLNDSGEEYYSGTWID